MNDGIIDNGITQQIVGRREDFQRKVFLFGAEEFYIVYSPATQLLVLALVAVAKADAYIAIAQVLREVDILRGERIHSIILWYYL